MRLRTALGAVVGVLLCIGVIMLAAFGALPVGRSPVAVASGTTPDPTPLPPPVAAAPATPPSAPPAPSSGPSQNPTATPLPTPTPTPPALPSNDPIQRPALQRRLTALLDDPELPRADALGVSVVDETGRQVFDHRDDNPLLPASTQKLVAAAGALALFGPEHRFTTEVAGTATVGADGVLAGDLVLIGGGDPALATPQFAEHVNPDRPRTPMEVLADALVAGGLRRLTGQVVGDPTVLPHQPQPEGWLESYVDEGDGTLSAGLTVDGGRRLLIENGAFASVISGDPAAQAAAALHSLLVDREVVIDLGPRATREPPTAPHVLARVQSPPLSDLLSHTLQHSDNHLADMLFRMTGLAAGGDGSWESAAAAMPQALEALDLDWSTTVLADGSGLSRDDRLSPSFLTALDARMTQSNFGSEWRELMAVSGESGTLRNRLRGTVADGRLRGKTGSLSDVRSLAGTVVGPDGTRYHFAVVGNDLDPPTDAAVRKLQDEVVLTLTEDLYGCRRMPSPTATPTAPDHAPPPPAEPGYELVCDAA